MNYCAIYYDELGCDKAEVSLNNKGFILRVRDFTFYSETLNFDFCTDKPEEAKKLFYLKDNELINYVLDIRIPLKLKHKCIKSVENFILRIEREKNYYSYTLYLEEQDKMYEVNGYSLNELILKMKSKLEKDYILMDDMPHIYAV